MFGLLRPPEAGLRGPSSHQQQRSYCGLCQSVGEHYGQALRAVHSHDAVFIGLLAEGLQLLPSERSSTRCPMLPVVHKDTMAPQSAPMRYAAAVQMLLGDQWLADKQVDGELVGQLGRPLLGQAVVSARAQLQALGVDLSALTGFESAQKAIESADPSLDDVAAPTAMALSLVFGQTAVLPGASQAARAPEVATHLESLGHAVGRSIYVIDALEDLEQDWLRGDFNPLLRRGAGGAPQIDALLVEAAVQRLSEDEVRIDEALAGLPLHHNREVLTSILKDSLVARGKVAAAEAQRKASLHGQQELARLAARPLLVKLFQAVGLMLFALWATASETAQAGVRWLRPAPLVPRTDDCAKCCNCEKECTRQCDQCKKPCDDCCKSCDQCSDSCNRCGDSCNGCSKCADDCGKGADCCQGCSAIGHLIRLR